MPIADIDYLEYFTQEAIDKLGQHYEKADTNHDGRINEAELAIMMKKQGRNMSRSQVRDLLRSVDFNGTGMIEFEELCVMEIMMNDLKPRPDLITYTDYLLDGMFKNLQNHFVQRDSAQIGTIDFDAVCDIMEAMMSTATQETLQTLFKQVDSAGEGRIDFSQLCALYAVAARLRKKCNYREFLTREQVASFRKLFSSTDTRGTGKISFQEMEQILRRVGLQVKKAQIQHLVSSFDVDRSGDIDFEEFCVMMLRLRGLRRQEVLSPATRECKELWLQEEFTVKELHQSGFRLEHFREAGLPVGLLVKDGGITALELRRAGYSPLELRRGGLGAEELRRCGFSLGDLRNAGFSDVVLRNANHMLKGCFSAGDLSPLPQRRPMSKEGSRPVRGAVLKGAGAAQLVPVPGCQWQLPERPMTQMIREHTDWRPMLSRNSILSRNSSKQQGLSLLPLSLSEGL